jgi:uncharacterized protein (TIGR02172 family)
MANLSPNETQLYSESLIGSGLTSEVFSWGDTRALKLFLPWVTEATIQREFLIAQATHAAGVPIPAAFEMVQIGKRLGIVLERVRGDSLVRQVERKPWTLFAAARQLAELHAHIHSFAAPDGLPTQREQLDRWTDQAESFSDAKKAEARRHVARLPAASCLCHGDFHPGNIILTANGPVIIDWSGATRGHALGDVARTSVLFESASLPPSTPLHILFLMKVSRRLLHSTYLKRYLELRPGTMEEIETWRVAQRMAGAAWRAWQRDAMAKAGIKPWFRENL